MGPTEIMMMKAATIQQPVGPLARSRAREIQDSNPRLTSYVPAGFQIVDPSPGRTFGSLHGSPKSEAVELDLLQQLLSLSHSSAFIFYFWQNTHNKGASNQPCFALLPRRWLSICIPFGKLVVVFIVLSIPLLQETIHIMIYALYGIGAALTLFWFFLLRPRTGGKDAPPTVTSSPIMPFPIFGVMAEFFKSPNSMVKRCTADIGPVFTIPVSPPCEIRHW